MRIAVISPHYDDAVFSACENMLHRPNDEFTIIVPIGAIPAVEPHRSKYLKLAAEHHEICQWRTHWKTVIGPFVDDAVNSENFSDDCLRLTGWLWDVCKDGFFDEAWTPLGIHHPDHIAVRIACNAVFAESQTPRVVYEELPYCIQYPSEVRSAIWALGGRIVERLGSNPDLLEQKKEICRMYASQIGPDIERSLYVHERLWRLR